MTQTIPRHDVAKGSSEGRQHGCCGSRNQVEGRTPSTRSDRRHGCRPTESCTPRLVFDTKQINKDVPIREVIARYTGVLVPNGSKNIRCPSVNHNDTKPSAHIYGNNCKCFSCGGNFSPLTLAREQYPELSFPDVCEQLLRDFNLDVYDYSNKAEVEAAMCAKKENRFHDHFPLTEEEFNFIGLANYDTNKKTVYYVKASEYYAFYGDEPSDEQVYDEDGNERIFAINEFEAIQMELVPENIKELRGNFTSPTLQQMWKQGKEDRDHVEEMLVGKCYETIERLDDEIEALEKAIEQYHEDHSKAEIEKIAKMWDGYVEICVNGGAVRLTEAQKNKFEEYLALEQNGDVKLSSLNEERDYAEEILGKVLDHQKRRASEGRTNKKEKESWGRE